MKNHNKLHRYIKIIRKANLMKQFNFEQQQADPNERRISQKAKKNKFKQMQVNLSLMSQSVIQAILLLPKASIPDCYIVMGHYVSQPRTFEPFEPYYEQIDGVDLKLGDCQNRIQLWSYSPQKLIQRWQIKQNNLKQSQLCQVFENEKWQLMIKIRTSAYYNFKHQKPNALSSQSSHHSSKPSSKSKSKSKKKLAMVKQILRQKINLLTVKPKPKVQASELQTYCYSSCSSKYPSFFNNSSGSHPENYKSCLDICAKNENKTDYNTEALSIYGFDGPKQLKSRRNSKQFTSKNILANIC